MSSLTRLFAFPLLIKLWGKGCQIFCLFLHLREAASASASKPRLALLRWFQVVVEGDTARLAQGEWRVLYYRWFPHQGGIFTPQGTLSRAVSGNTWRRFWLPPLVGVVLVHLVGRGQGMLLVPRTTSHTVTRPKMSIVSLLNLVLNKHISRLVSLLA